VKLRFFCDQCGTEVPRNTERCPSCGRYFTAVQCPRCGFQGRDSDFLGGCPTCGYMRKPREPEPSGGAGKRPPGRVRRDRGQAAGGARGRSPRPPLAPAGAPPRLYRVLSLVLAGLLVVLLAVLFLR
jgi:hypothetical protein